MNIAKGYSLLRSDKHKTLSKFQKKFFNLSYKSFFKV